MASISHDQDGGKRLLFVYPSGTRRTIRLGAISRREAERIKGHVEALRQAKLVGGNPPADTLAWLDSVSAELRNKLAMAGLADPPKDILTIQEWCRQYIESRTDLAPRSIARLEYAARLLVEYFGPQKRVDEVTPSDAIAYSKWPGLGRAPNTVRRRIGWARQFYNAAVKAGLVQKNPFSDIPAGTRPNRGRDAFVTRDTFHKLLEACPDAEWRAILTLTRISGLRCPTEVLALEWCHVLWDQGKLVVPCIKTASITGERYRVTPLFPETREVLEQLFGQATEGTRYVINRYRNKDQNLRTGFQRICQRAGVPSIEKPFMNLRASRATELAEEYPSHVAAAWLGHSEKIAIAHYRQVTEEHFRRATQTTPSDPSEVAHFCAQQDTESSCNNQKVNWVVCPLPLGGRISCDKIQEDSVPSTLDVSPYLTSYYTRRESNTPSFSREKPTSEPSGGAKARTLDCTFARSFERDLEFLCSNWASLPLTVRRQVLALVRGSLPLGSLED